MNKEDYRSLITMFKEHGIERIENYLDDRDNIELDERQSSLINNLSDPKKELRELYQDYATFKSGGYNPTPSRGQSFLRGLKNFGTSAFDVGHNYGSNLLNSQYAQSGISQPSSLTTNPLNSRTKQFGALAGSAALLLATQGLRAGKNYVQQRYPSLNTVANPASEPVSGVPAENYPTLPLSGNESNKTPVPNLPSIETTTQVTKEQATPVQKMVQDIINKHESERLITLKQSELDNICKLCTQNGGNCQNNCQGNCVNQCGGNCKNHNGCGGTIAIGGNNNYNNSDTIALPNNEEEDSFNMDLLIETEKDRIN